MKFKTTLLGLLLVASAASASDLRDAFHDLHKQSINTLLNIHEKVLTDSQRLVLNKELQVREREMSHQQRERLYAHPSYHGKGHGRDHAPGQQKKKHKGGKHH